MKKIRVLIADDVEQAVEKIETILQSMENIEIVGTAKDGKEELEKILELQPDLVLTDNQMPGLNGIDVIEKINNEYKEQCKCDFIIISADININVRAIKLGVFQTIEKPYTDNDIIKVIEDYVGFSDYIEETEIKAEKKSFFGSILDKLKRK